jgi:DNA-binding transcriptional regulator YiaG
MPNIASILKNEISRVARRELKVETLALRKAVVAQRKEIAALKRRTLSLEQTLRRASREQPKSSSGPGETASVEGRFSAKGLRSQRRRLGISAAQCGLLLGATAQSVYNWEQGKARPSARHMPAVTALKSLGKRQAAATIAARSG